MKLSILILGGLFVFMITAILMLFLAYKWTHLSENDTEETEVWRNNPEANYEHDVEILKGRMWEYTKRFMLYWTKILSPFF